IHAYDWNDFELLRRWFSGLGDLPEQSVLFVCPEWSSLRTWLASDSRVETLVALNQRIAAPSGKRYRYILLHAATGVLNRPKRIFEPLLGLLDSGGEIAVFFSDQRRIPATGDLNAELRTFISQSMRRHRNDLAWDIQLVNGYMQRVLGALLFRASDRSL